MNRTRTGKRKQVYESHPYQKKRKTFSVYGINTVNLQK